MIAYPPERKNQPRAAGSRAVGFFCQAILLLTLSAHAQSTGKVTLAWNPDSVSGLAGYHLYEGIASGTYTNDLSVGNQTNATISGLTLGVKYFFALTAYTSNGLESPFSNEISYTPGTNALPTIVLSSPATGSTYTAPGSISLAASVTPNGHTISKVQFFSGAALLGQTTNSPYTLAWNGVAAGSYVVSAQVVYDSTNSVSSASVAVTVSAAASSLSFASTSGTISSPFVVSNGLVFQTTTTGTTGAGTAVYNFNVPVSGNYLISAQVSAPSIAANSFYVNVDANPTDPETIWDVPVTTGLTLETICWRGNTNTSGTPGEDQFSPKIFNLTQGSHQLVIWGREGNTQLGSITISPTNSTAPPLIVVTAPNNNSSYAAPAAVTVAASLTPNGHSIAKVQFFTGTTLLGESLTAPYAISWNNIGPGNYSLTATAVYDTNSTVSSSAVNMVVTNVMPSNVTLGVASGSISSPFLISNGMLFQTNTTGVASGGRAVYNFTVPTSGDYLISALINAPSIAANSFYVNIDADPTDPYMIWDTAITTNFVNQTVCWRGNTNSNGTPGADQFTPKVFNLTQGAHQLIIVGREAYTELGTITISPATVLPPPWQALDIGNVGITGGASVSNSTYQVSGAGSLSGSSDTFRFLYQPMTGDGDVRARINSLQNVTSNACAGVIIRETLTPGSEYAFVGIQPNGTVWSQTRTSTASGSSGISSGTLAPPNSWARLVRSNNAVLAYKSSDGATWTLVSSNSITMATNIYFGLAVASGTTNAPSSAMFTNVVAIP